MKTIADLQEKVKKVAFGLAGGVEVLSEEDFDNLSQSIDDMVLIRNEIEEEKGFKLKAILSTVSDKNTGHNLLTRILDCDNLPEKTKKIIVKCLDLKLFDPNKPNATTGEFPIDLVIKKHNGDLQLLEALFNSGAKIGKYINVNIYFKLNQIARNTDRNLSVIGSLELQKLVYLTDDAYENYCDDLYKFLSSDLLKNTFPLKPNMKNSRMLVNVKKVESLVLNTGSGSEEIMRVDYSVNFKLDDIIEKKNSEKSIRSVNWGRICEFFDEVDPRFLDPRDLDKAVVGMGFEGFRVLDSLDFVVSCVSNPKVIKKQSSRLK